MIRFIIKLAGVVPTIIINWLLPVPFLALPVLAKPKSGFCRPTAKALGGAKQRFTCFRRRPLEFQLVFINAGSKNQCHSIKNQNY